MVGNHRTDSAGGEHRQFLSPVGTSIVKDDNIDLVLLAQPEIFPEGNCCRHSCIWILRAVSPGFAHSRAVSRRHEHRTVYGRPEQTLKAYLGEQRWSPELWHRFCGRVDYVSVQFTDVSQYASLSQRLSSERVAVFYFATPPSLFQTICENLSGSGCLTERSRVVLEKPIGRNHANCKK